MPTFLIIGAMKAGTSSLWRYLNSHPAVHMSRTKELDFFLEEWNWRQGLNWYDSQFQVNDSCIRAVGEASTSYTKYPSYSGVPARIASVLPHVQLVYLVRDPIERIRSMYVHMVCEGGEKRTFDEVMATLENNHYVELSLYHLQLTQYLAFFPMEQMLVIPSEDLRDRRRETVGRVFRFIGVEDDFESPEFSALENRSEQKRRLKPLGRALQLLGLYDRLLCRLPASARGVYVAITTSVVGKPCVPQELRKRLVELIRPDTERLRTLVGEEFRSWGV